MFEGEQGRSGKDHESVVREKQRAAGSSVLAGLILTLLKLVVGVSTRSLGLLAEAAHSALDLGAAAMTWFAVRTSWRPPDADHQYGHGKVENLAALGESFLLVLTSVWILYEAADRILGRGPEVEPSIWAFLVMGISIVVDLVRSRDLRRVARKSGSQALEADALHFSTDIASSSVVIVGLAGVWVARTYDIAWLRLADPIAASVVALIVLALSWQLGRRAADMLLDRAPAGLARRVEKALDGLEGPEAVPSIRVRQSGDRPFVDVELLLPRELPLAEGERIAAAARERVREAIGANASVLIQLQARTDEGDSLRRRISTAVAMEGVHAHNITIRHDPERGCHADLHLELPGTLTLEEGHAIADRVERRVLRELPEVRRVDIHLEQHEEMPEPSGILDPEVREGIEARILAVARDVAGPDSVHDLLLVRTTAGLYLSCHCFVPAEASLAEVHELTDRLEHSLRGTIPGLARVAVHAEPHGA